MAFKDEIKSPDHEQFHFSVTVRTGDPAVVACLRALCYYSQRLTAAGKRQIGWGGTTEEAWRMNNQRVTFRFTESEYRQEFIEVAERLLGGHWERCSISNNDPAAPQR